MINLIVATMYCHEIEQYIIGADGKQPFRSSDDRARFRILTSFNTVVMGRKTYEDIGFKPLPRRTNIVLSRQRHFFLSEALVANALEDALEMASKFGQGKHVWIIGGGEVYKQALDLVLPDMIYLTEMKQFYNASGLETLAVFPKINTSDYTMSEDVVEKEDHFFKVFHKNSPDEL